MSTMRTAQKNKSVSYYILSAIGVALMFGFRFLPAFGEVTPIGMQVLGIFLGVIFLWCTVGIAWPSLLAIVALGMSDYTNMTGAISASMGSTVVWNILMAMFLVGAINQSGAGEFVARWIMSRKFLNGKPVLFTIFYLLSFYLVSIFSNGVAVLLLSWSITERVAHLLGTDFSNKYIKQLLIFASVSSALGEFVIPYKGWIFSLMSSYANVSGQDINYTSYLIFTLFFGFAMICLCTLSIKYIFRTDMSIISNLDVAALKDEKTVKLNYRQISYYLAFFFVIIATIVTTFLPASIPVIGVLKRLSTPGLFAVALIALIVIKVDGKPLLDFKKISSSAIRWENILICAAVIPVAGAVAHADAGVISTIGEAVTPFFMGKGTLFILVVVLLLALVLTNLGSNTGVGLLLIPLVIPILQQVGVSQHVFNVMSVALIYSCAHGYVLPGASAIAALLYTHEGLNTKDIVKYGTFFVLAYFVVAVPVFYIWMMLG